MVFAGSLFLWTGAAARNGALELISSSHRDRSAFLRSIRLHPTNGQSLWIPAFAGMTACFWMPAFAGMTAYFWMPAFAGMTAYFWIPAFAGMTGCFWIPAFAELTAYFWPPALAELTAYFWPPAFSGMTACFWIPALRKDDGGSLQCSRRPQQSRKIQKCRLDSPPR